MGRNHACGFVVGLLACAQNSAPEADPDSDLPNALAETTAGLVQGEALEDLAVFRGVPYARAPLGDLRWKPPEPPESWTEDRDATTFGPACPQLELNALVPAPKDQNEDCLTVNVWTPAQSIDQALPVMVWLHGGGFIIGQGSPSTVSGDGAVLARKGQVVVVTFNYRLGQLGFLAHSALSAESKNGVSGNYGLLDQIRALEWVRDNARAFGGDPNNVTIFGESAGGVSVCAMIASPLAVGLFDRAIMQSGPCVATMPTLTQGAGYYEAGEVVGQNFAEALGCSKAADPLGCMRDAATDDVLAALPAGIAWGPLSEGMAGQHYGPVVDGMVLNDSLRAVVEAVPPSVVPVIAGTNADEGTLFSDPFAKLKTIEEYTSLVESVFGEQAKEVLKIYGVEKPEQIVDVGTRLIGDLAFVCPTRVGLRALSALNPAYRYHFTHEGAIGAAFGLGVYHGSDVGYVFQDFDERLQWSDVDYAVSDTIIGYWTRFAATGDPNGQETDWPSYESGEEQYLVIDEATKTGEHLLATECDLLSRTGLF